LRRAFSEEEHRHAGQYGGEREPLGAAGAFAQEEGAEDG